MIEHGNAPAGIPGLEEHRGERLLRETERGNRRRVGIISMLDQFLDTRHDLPKREAMARDLGIKTVELEALMANATSGAPSTVLMARCNLTLAMAGAGRRTR